MMRLLDFLSEQGVDFTVKHHEEAYTAQEEAAAQHISGHIFAKTVVVRAGDEHILLVLPASHRVDFKRLREILGESVEMVDESELRELFPDCEVGAEPPFGSHYDMRTIVDEHLSEESDIAIRACSHSEIVLMSYEDFERLEEPEVASFAVAED